MADSRQRSWIALPVALLAGGFPLMGSVASALCAVTGIAAFFMMLRGATPVAKGTAINWLSAAILLHVAAGGLSLAMHPADQDNLDQFLMRLPFLLFVPLASIFAMLDRDELLRAVRTGAALGAMAAAVFAVYEMAYLRERAWGGSGNPGPYATVAAVQYGILVFALGARSARERYLYAAGAISAVWCIYASGMRSLFPLLLVFPAVLAASQFLGQGARNPARRDLRQRAMTRYFMLLLILAGGAAIASHERVWQIPAELGAAIASDPTDTSLGHRVAIVRFLQDNWQAAWPFGMGQDTAMKGLAAYTREHFGFSLGKTHMHNYFATAYVRGGIPDLVTSLIFLLALPVTAWVVWYRNTAGDGSGFALAFALWAAYFLSSQLNLAHGHDILDHFHVFMLAVVAVLWSAPGTDADQRLPQ